MTKPPQPGYYETVAGIITTLYVALAVEIRLLRPRTDMPADATKDLGRLGLLFGVATLLLPLLMGALGLMACLQALSGGSKPWTEDLAQLGVTFMLALFVCTSTEVFFRLIAQAFPWLQIHRKSVLVGIGAVLIAAGITITFTS